MLLASMIYFSRPGFQFCLIVNRALQGTTVLCTNISALTTKVTEIIFKAIHVLKFNLDV